MPRNTRPALRCSSCPKRFHTAEKLGKHQLHAHPTPRQLAGGSSNKRPRPDVEDVFDRDSASTRASRAGFAPRSPFSRPALAVSGATHPTKKGKSHG
jgi:hypothetical protein